MDGADFVDLHGEIDNSKKQDNITVAVPLDYLSEDTRKSMEENDSSEWPAPAPPPGVVEEEDNVAVEEEITEEEINDLLRDV